MGIVNAVAADASAATEWTSRIVNATSRDPMEQLSVVVGDVGIHLSVAQRTHLARAVSHDWARRLGALTSADNVGEELANTVERVVVGWTMSPLPCHYGDVLDISDAQPGREAIGALELAHAIVDLVDFDGKTEFLGHFARVWSALQAERRLS
ncbi:MAG: hypothetical protein ACR2KK_05390 [Acidimicrobiales bacterium]